jgi:predicted RNase H-like nuclease (RuvC/YqgF family)
METNQNETRWKKLFISAVIAMLIINGVIVYFLLDEKQQKQQVTEQKTSLEQDYRAVSDTLDARRLDIEQLRGKNASLDKLIAEKEQMLDQEKQTLADEHSKNTLTATELDKARKMIAQYEVTIASLQNELADYKQQTKQLTVEKTALTTDLECEKETTAQLSDENTGLTKKVVAGSFLQIPNVNVEAVHKKHNGEEVSTEKAKNAESLKVSFETGVNKVLDPGKVSLYVRIINPRGETLAVSGQGSGIIPETVSQKPVEYTKKADINYTQTNKKVVLYWTRNIQLPGTYRVEVYQDGKVVGKGAVRLS